MISPKTLRKYFVPKSIQDQRGTDTPNMDSCVQVQAKIGQGRKSHYPFPLKNEILVPTDNRYDRRTWLNTKELADYLGTSVGSVRNMVWRGQITAYRFLKILLFKKVEIDRMIESGRAKTFYEKD